jgi:hypothetical protein
MGTVRAIPWRWRGVDLPAPGPDLLEDMLGETTPGLLAQVLHARPPIMEVRMSPVTRSKIDADHQLPASPVPEQGHREPTPDEVAAEAAAIYPDTFDSAPTPEEIAAEAHAIYVARGSTDGRDLDDWLEAERALKARRGFTG